MCMLYIVVKKVRSSKFVEVDILPNNKTRPMIIYDIIYICSYTIYRSDPARCRSLR